MLRFLIRRTALGVLVLWLISMIIFALFFVAPSNVARTLAGRQATPETVALIQHRLHLDLPIWQQYLGFVGRALHGDLGFDYYHQVPVTTGHRRGRPHHRLPRARVCDPVAGDWRLQRRDVGDQATIIPRPVADGVCAVLLLDAVVPAWSADAVLPLLPAHPCRHQSLSPGWLRTSWRRYRSVGAAPHPALAHSCSGVSCHLHQAHPRLDAGCPW